MDPLTLGSLTGFLTFTVTTHPRSPVAKRRPKIRLFNKIELQPQLKIFYRKQKALILHHWLAMAIILVFSFFFFEEHVFIRGFLIGGVGQGLTYRDRFHLKQDI